VTVALWLFAAQGALGAFDTLWYHEWRARLPALGPAASAELRLHAVRDFVYAALFSSLPRVAWQGACAWLLFVLLATEIVITLADFVVEDRVREPLGGVYPGERVTHALMGIVYGAALGCLTPVVWRWTSLPTGFRAHENVVPLALQWTLAAMAAGVLLSGIRDALAARGVRAARWPWGPRVRA
jgi:hypothetical protein